MRNLMILVCLMVAQAVFAVPITRGGSADSDEIEQELIRHHHATSEEGQKQQLQQQFANINNAAGLARGNAGIGDTKSRVSGTEEDSTNALLDDENLYDFTVADVLADIIYELKKNPVLLEQLIESERQKVESKIEEMNLAAAGRDSYVDSTQENPYVDAARQDPYRDSPRQDQYEDNLSSFQRTAEQLKNEPKRVEKKAGRSGMPVVSEPEEKRAQEVIDNNYAHTDVSKETRDLQDFLNMAQVGDATSLDATDNNQNEAGHNVQGEAKNPKTNGMNGYEVYEWMRHLPGFEPVQNLQGGPFPQYQRLLPQAPAAAGNNKGSQVSEGQQKAQRK